MRNPILLAALAALAVHGCGRNAEPAGTAQSAVEEKLVEFEEFKLENGLNVVFHIDLSEPVVAVALTAHVG